MHFLNNLFTKLSLTPRPKPICPGPPALLETRPPPAPISTLPVPPKNIEDTFTDIYKSNGFRGADSISGPGSDTHQTRFIIGALPALWKDFRIATVLDIPCGDFYWMRHVDLSGIHYTGADIVAELIAADNASYARADIRFESLNLILSPLPRVDLIFTRDCLVHFSYAEIRLALANICQSDSQYFLATTFTDREENHDIRTGDWRPINLEKPPFNLPPPLQIINEGCTENDGAYPDKSLALWKVADLRASAFVSGPR